MLTRRPNRQSGDQWSKTETTTLLNAVRHAPVLHPERPYVLQLGERTASLYQLGAAQRHERAGINRLVYCGTALANLFLAVRSLGWRATMEIAGDGMEPDLVAVVRAVARAEPTAAELWLHRRVERMDPYWAEPSPWPGEATALDRLLASNWCPGTDLRLLSDRSEVAAAARLVLHAGRRLDGDRWCADELRPWLTPQPSTLSPVPTTEQRPVATLVEPYADAVCAIAARLVSGPVLLVCTRGDTPRDHVLAGAAVQNARLAAAALGLWVRPVSRLIRLDEVRAGLAEQLGVDGYVHALLRVGLPPEPES
ncbi:hypothetical protein GCM10010174_39350 [Kutzneria viridogrisea]|uniref:Nitroreductase n=1 Tax=Kutzneria viridogrisea TaxID=47990 RepID=A0ABR6BMR9_9PSEU|nr:nitroreductase [Kutzneria viridogrisea]